MHMPTRALIALTAILSLGSASVARAQAPPAPEKKPDPFAFADFTWLSGNPRTKESPIDTKVFTGEFRVDTNFTYSFNKPADDTISGSSEIFRSGEFQLTQLGVGGDFHYDNVLGRVMTQFGMYSQTTPRNDASPGRGQWDLSTAYRYISEAYGGYHFDKMNGINLEAGIFMSYVGLWSYYNFDNWTYQPSYVSSNTPWFFNGMRVQIFPSEKLKIEPWVVNGWQSYGKFNHTPGVGGQVLYRPNGSVSVSVNNYWGTDTLGNPDRKRVHTDDSIQWKYYDRPDAVFDKAAMTFTFDAGCEFGGGVSCSGGTAAAPSQYFLGFMTYQRFWFDKDRYALTVGGGDRQSWPIPRADAADQRRDGFLGDALLHLQPRRSVQGLGHADDVRFHAESVRDVPRGVQLPARERAVFHRRGRRDAARRQHRRARIVRAGLGARPAQIGEPSHLRAAREDVTFLSGK
jgi:hypothetical protein